MAKLTRDEMIQHISQGRTVVHEGRMLTHPDHVPSDVDLAASGTDRKAAEDRLQKRIDELQAELARAKAKDDKKGGEPENRDAKAAPAEAPTQGSKVGK